MTEESVIEKKQSKRKEVRFADLTHDTVFKELSKNREFRVSFLKQYMPKELVESVDWGSVDLYSLNVEHVRQQDKDNVKTKEQSDAAFMFRFGNGKNGMAFCHIENQTTADKTIILRSIHYQTSILLDYSLSNPNKKLPLVFSIIYYANKKPFPYSDSIYDYFEDPGLAKRYAFKSELVDLSGVDDEELMGHGYVSLYELVFKHIRQGTITDVLDRVSMLLVDYDHPARLLMIKYINYCANMQPEEFYDTMIRNQPGLRGDIMTIADILEDRGMKKGMQKGMQQGMQQGRAEGENKKAREIALEMLKNGQTVEMVAVCSKLSTDDVRRLKAATSH